MLGPFTEGKPDVVLIKFKAKKLLSLMKYLQKYRRQVNLLTFQLCYTDYKQNTIEKWTKGCILSFPKKGDLRTAKNS